MAAKAKKDPALGRRIRAARQRAKAPPFRLAEVLCSARGGAKGGALAQAVRRLLRYSWQDIAFRYEHLTPQERECITREQHRMLVPWVRGDVE